MNRYDSLWALRSRDRKLIASRCYLSAPVFPQGNQQVTPIAALDTASSNRNGQNGGGVDTFNHWLNMRNTNIDPRILPSGRTLISAKMVKEW
jgi:hypothetical protein